MYFYGSVKQPSITMISLGRSPTAPLSAKAKQWLCLNWEGITLLLLTGIHEQTPNDTYIAPAMIFYHTCEKCAGNLSPQIFAGYQQFSKPSFPIQT